MSHVVALLPEDRLTLVADDSVVPLIEPWIPLGVTRWTERAMLDGDICVRANTDAASSAESQRRDLHSDPLLRLGTARAVRLPDGTIALFGESATSGRLDLERQRAVIEVDLAGDHSTVAAHDAYSMLTIAAALMLGLKGMALVHAGAVADRSGMAWMVVGDSHAGKTSTCTALVEAGWSFLADDQIIIANEPDGTRVWGWPRRAHLDGGWMRGEVTGVRETVNLVERWPQRVMQSAPLAGVLLPRVIAHERTEARAAHPAGILTALIRQSPWLVSDQLVAARVLPLLQAAATTRAYDLVLGRDSYARGDVLQSRLELAQQR
jgi:hypothetical protein